ncbi:MAG: hypothetical protein ACK5QA_13050 [Dolichospermum sp.]
MIGEEKTITNYLLPITHYPLPITHYLLPITHLRNEYCRGGVKP